MSPKEKEILRENIKELVKKWMIQKSLSLFVVPALLKTKKGGSWRICIYSCGINKVIIGYRFPIPQLDNMLNQLCCGIIFSKIDLRNEYYYIRIWLGDEWKMTFKIKDGLYEWLIMPFRLTNTLDIFIRLTNKVWWPLINKFVMVYFDVSLCSIIIKQIILSTYEVFWRCC